MSKWLLRGLVFSALMVVVRLLQGALINAWESWGRLQVASRISVITDASASMFKAMHNLRTDRSTTNRLLMGAAPMDSDIEKYLRSLRDAEMPAMASALGLALAGPRRYGEQIVADSFLNAEARKEATPGDIGRALDLLIAACMLQAAAYAALALAV